MFILCKIPPNLRYILEMLTAQYIHDHFVRFCYMTFVQGQLPYMVVYCISLELIKIETWNFHQRIDLLKPFYSRSSPMTLTFRGQGHGSPKKRKFAFLSFFEGSNGNVYIWIDLSVAYRLGTNVKCLFCAEFHQICCKSLKC